MVELNSQMQSRSFQTLVSSRSLVWHLYLSTLSLCLAHKKRDGTGVHVKKLSGIEVTQKLSDREEMVEKRFQSTFKLLDKVKGERELEVGRVALSNLLGNIGYFYRQSLIAIPLEHQVGHETKDGDVWKYRPAALYAAVPSCSFFPHGFLWDEGFHQLLVSWWDRKISKEIVAHWLDLLNIDGWIPREQILGDEARRTCISLCNRESDFQTKKTKSFLRGYIQDLKLGFNARTPPKLTLMSGLDDYPRASHPSDHERHLDLQCWMALAAQSLAKIAFIVGASNGAYMATTAQLTDLRLLNKLHYDRQWALPRLWTPH